MFIIVKGRNGKAKCSYICWRLNLTVLCQFIILQLLYPNNMRMDSFRLMPFCQLVSAGAKGVGGNVTTQMGLSEGRIRCELWEIVYSRNTERKWLLNFLKINSGNSV